MKLKIAVGISLALFFLTFTVILVNGLILNDSNSKSNNDIVENSDLYNDLGSGDDYIYDNNNPEDDDQDDISNDTPVSNLDNDNLQTNNSQPSNPNMNPSNPSKPTPTPKPDPEGCFVIIFDKLYNLKPALNNEVKLKNVFGSTKRNTHTEADILCGTFSSPTDNTSLFMSKHLNSVKIQCYPSLAEYYAGSGSPPNNYSPICEPA